jgi:hypothetical protein
MVSAYWLLKLILNSYADPYVSLVDGVGAFFGNRSFVIHFANTTRYVCANFRPTYDIGSNSILHSAGGHKPTGSGYKGTGKPSVINSGTFPTSIWSGYGGSSDPFPSAFSGGAGGFGGFDKPAVQVGGPNDDSPFGIPSGAGDLSSFLSNMASYTSYWASSTTSTAAYAAAATSTVEFPTTSAATVSSVPTDTGNLPPLPGTVTASGFNVSTSLLISGSRTPVPVVFNGGAEVTLANKFVGVGVVLVVGVLISI